MHQRMRGFVLAAATLLLISLSGFDLGRAGNVNGYRVTVPPATWESWILGLGQCSASKGTRQSIPAGFVTVASQSSIRPQVVSDECTFSYEKQVTTGCSCNLAWCGTFYSSGPCLRRYVTYDCYECVDHLTGERRTECVRVSEDETCTSRCRYGGYECDSTNPFACS